jgi:SAM-dependent methyltransferase
VEGYGSASYGDAFADVYDEWYPASRQTGDAVVALARLAGPGPVLELGCGTGRLGLPLVELGLEVTGIDASEAMLAQLAAKPGADRLEAHRGDMARFDLGAHRFALVFAAFNTLFNLGSAEEQSTCFASVARHLAPGGRFAVECFVPPEPPEVPGPAEGDDGPGVSGSGPGGGAATNDAIELRALAADRVVLLVSRQDPAAQTISGQHVELTDAGVRLRPWHLRYASVAELDAYASAVGLVVEHRWADWAGAGFDGAGQHVTVYRAADPGPSRHPAP